MISKQKLNAFLRRFGFELHGTGYLQSVAKQSFKEDCFSIQKSMINKRDITIFDVGANKGKISEIYLDYFPAARIFAFEPFPASMEQYKNRIKNNPRVQTFLMALGDRKGVSKLSINKNADTNSLLESKKMGLSSDDQVVSIGNIDVEVETIDGFCKEKGIEHIDILKLDIQGGELAALKGAEDMLRYKKIGMIYSETYFKQQYKDQPLFHDISKYLETVGYAIQDFYNPIYGKGSIAWCDVIFLPKE